MSYRPGKSARKMYQHKARYGTAGMSKRQLRALAREMDIGVNPKRRKKGHRSAQRRRGRERERRAAQFESAYFHNATNPHGKKRAAAKKRIADRFNKLAGRSGQRRRRIAPAGIWRRLDKLAPLHRKTRAGRVQGRRFIRRYEGSKWKALGGRKLNPKRPSARSKSRRGADLRKWTKRMRGAARNPRRTFRKVWPGDRVLLGKRRGGHGRRNPDEHRPHFTRQFPDGGRIDVWLDGEVVVSDAMDRDLDDYFLKPSEVPRFIQDVQDARLARWHHFSLDMIRGEYELQGRGGKQKRNPGHKHRSKYARWTSDSKRRGRVTHDRSHGIKRDRRGRRRNPLLMNPKRDGSPTRGEMRRSKYEVHLAAIVQRGEETKAKLKLVKKTPIGKTTPHFYEQQSALKPHVVEAAGLSAIPSAPAIVKQERAEVSEAMHELNEALAHLQGRLRDIGEDAPDDEIDEVHRQIADIAKQKKKLREAAEATPVMSNPRPRGKRGYHLRGLASYAKSLGRYCNAIHAYCRSYRRSSRARR